jgi:hypothetical protein
MLVAHSSEMHRPQTGEARILRDTANLLLQKGYDVSLLSMANETKKVVDGKYCETVVGRLDFTKLSGDKPRNYYSFLDSLIWQFQLQREACNSSLELKKHLNSAEPDIIITSNFFMPNSIDLMDVMADYKKSKGGRPKLVVLSDEFGAVNSYLNLTRESFIKANGALSPNDAKISKRIEAMGISFAKEVYFQMLNHADAVVFYTDEDLNTAKVRYQCEEEVMFKERIESKLTRVQPSIEIGDGKIVTREKLESAVFFGNSNNITNGMAKTAITEQIAPKVPELTFVVAGLGGSLYTKGNVSSMGAVDDPSAVIGASDLYIAPLTGGTGIQTKLIDPIRAGVPIISTANAAQGFPAVNGVNMIIEDKIDLFPQRIRELSGREIRHELALNARRDMRNYFSSEIVGKRWDDLISGLLRK